MGPFHVILLDLAQPRRGGGQHWIEPLWEALLGRHDPLEHQLAGEVDIDVVVEYDRDLRQGEFGEGSDLR